MDTELHKDLAEAFDKATETTKDGGDSAPATPPDVVSGTPIGAEKPSEPAKPIVGSDGRPRDEKGRYLSDKPPDLAPKEGLAAKVPEPQVVSTAPAPNPAPERPKAKAPASWKPTTREGWDKLPEDIQQEVIRREREISTALQESSEARQNYGRFRETVAPYEHMFRAEGVDPIQGIGNLMRTTAALISGAPATKANIVAGIIKTYGVDIATLDSILSGQVGQSQAPQHTQEFRDPRLDSLLARVEQERFHRETALQKQAREAISEIEQEEFFEDVRDEMADILEIASRRGLAMTPKEAYNRAIALHPEVSKVIEQRKAAANHGSTQRAIAASSSVRGQPTAAPAAPSGNSLHDDIEEAMKRLSNRQ